MKERELRELATCCVCHKKMGECVPYGLSFYKVTVEEYVPNFKAMERQQGLGMMMGGHGLLAQVMGPDEDMATLLNKGKPVMVCQNCAYTYPTDGIFINSFEEDNNGEEKPTT